MSLVKEINCDNCGNSCTVHYEENPNDEEILFCPYCGFDLDSELDEFNEEDDEF